MKVFAKDNVMLKLNLPVSHIFETRIFYILNRKSWLFISNSVLMFIKDLNSYKYPLLVEYIFLIKRGGRLHTAMFPLVFDLHSPFL